MNDVCVPWKGKGLQSEGCRQMKSSCFNVAVNYTMSLWVVQALPEVRGAKKAKTPKTSDDKGFIMVSIVNFSTLDS